MGRVRGFTLVELMVVVAIVSLLLTFGYVGFSQLGARRMDEDAEALLRWVESLGDRAQLEGAVYGIGFEADEVVPLAYREGRWLIVRDRQLWRNASRYRLEFELANNAEEMVSAVSGERIQPEVILLPDGSLWPEGRLILASEERSISLGLENGNWLLQDQSR